MTIDDDPYTALEVVDRVRRRARVDALHDLDRVQAKAVDDGRHQAELLVRSSLRRPGSKTARYNQSAGLLRDWYTTVYTAELAAGLRGAGTVPGPAEVEQTAAQLHRRSPQREAQDAFRAVALLYRLAREDATVAATAVYDEMMEAAVTRAAGYIDHAIDNDPVRTPILRHWYQRCYLDTFQTALGLQQLLKVVTQAEATMVAACVQHGEFRRIIGPDGIPLVNVIEAFIEPGQLNRGAENRDLGARVTRLWSELDWPGRLEWVRAADAGDVSLSAKWSQIPDAQQSALIAQWLDTHRQDPSTHQPVDDVVVGGDLIHEPSRQLITGAPESSAAEMFRQPRHRTEPIPSTTELRPARRLSSRVEVTLAQIRGRQAEASDARSESLETNHVRHRKEQAHHNIVGHDHDLPER